MRYPSNRNFLPKTVIALTTIVTFGFVAHSEERPARAQFDDVELVETLAPAEQALVEGATDRFAPVGLEQPELTVRDDQPDRVADYVGGIAARLHSGDGEPIPGDVFLLMAVTGSDAGALVYDHTRYPVDGDQIHPEAIESNEQAIRTIEAITGTELQMVDFTSAPGGGPSAGITYAIAYLNIISDGAFTGDLVVAATGHLKPYGYVYPINSINEKTAAAHLAGTDVLFTPIFPDAELIRVHGARVVGELFGARNTGSTLAEERQWNNYDRWGNNRPDNDMDVVGIRHIGDVAAYLCGAGSDFACDITHLLENVVTDSTHPTAEATVGAPADPSDTTAWVIPRR